MNLIRAFGRKKMFSRELEKVLSEVGFLREEGLKEELRMRDIMLAQVGNRIIKKKTVKYTLGVKKYIRICTQDLCIGSRYSFCW